MYSWYSSTWYRYRHIRPYYVLRTRYSLCSMQTARCALYWSQLVEFQTWLDGNFPSSSYCTEDFLVYIIYVQNLTQGFHSLSRHNLKIGPWCRNYASVQFQSGFEQQLNSHSKVMTHAHTMTLKSKENSWNSLFQLPKHGAFNQIFACGVFWSSIASSCKGLMNIRPVLNVTGQHASFFNHSLSMPLLNFLAPTLAINQQ